MGCIMVPSSLKHISYLLFTSIFLFFAAISLQAVPVEGEQGILEDKEITFISDLHFIDKDNDQHQSDFVNSIPDKENTLVIVEDYIDTSSIEEYLKKIENTEYRSELLSSRLNNNDGHFLLNLSSICSQSGLKVYNTEYRHLAEASELSDSKILIRDVKYIQEKIKKEIRGYISYLNKPIINDTYNTIIQNANKKIQQIFGNGENDNITIHKFLEEVISTAQKEKTKVKADAYTQLVTHDSELLDARILNQILTTDKKKIVVCAGQSHIDQIKVILNDIGYQTIHSRTSPVYSQEEPTFFSSLFEKLPTSIKKLLGYRELVAEDESFIYKPLNIKEFLSKPRMPFWLKKGVGATALASCYILYKRLSN